MKHEKLLFEMASGWDFHETSSERYNTTMRDYFVQLMITRYPIPEIADAIGKHRTSIYASLKRFELFYEIEKPYAKEFDEIQNRFYALELAETY